MWSRRNRIVRRVIRPSFRKGDIQGRPVTFRDTGFSGLERRIAKPGGYLTGIARLLARGAHCEPMQPLRAVLHSEGVITGDHNFGLSGPIEVLPHPLFGPEGVSVVVLPGH